jgi:Protein of unknown function (DUF3987)
MKPVIDFEGINQAALSGARRLLPELIPGGKFRSLEYIVRNPSRNDKNPGSFKINYRTGVWKDFATSDGGSDFISLVAYIRGCGQGDAARVLAEKLAVPLHKANGIASTPKANGALSAGSLAGAGEAKDGAAAKVYQWGEEGPPVERNEIRRHYYPKNGKPRLKVKIKKRDVPKSREWITCYRVFRDNAPVGWQWAKPTNYRSVPYAAPGTDTKKIFWPEGEKDNDTLNKFGFSAFTFGGGDGLPDDIDEYLKRILRDDRTLIIPIDNDVGGRQQGLKKAQKADACGIKHIRIFDPATVWPECPEGGDITDWFEKGGGTRERLIEIVDALPDWQPSANDDDDTLTKEADAGPSWDYPDLSLLDDRRGELPPFPLDVFSPSLQEWATNAAHGAGTTVDHVLVPLLSIASSLIGTARRPQASKSWSEPSTLWTAIVGDSGAGKTPGLDVSQRALARIERSRKHLIGELRRAHESRIEIAKAVKKQWQGEVEEAIKADRKPPDMPADAEMPEPFEAPRLFVSNATIEKLAKLLLARPQGMLLIGDELAGLFLNFSRYSGGSDREFWLEAWNGKPHRVERLNRPPVDVEHLLVGLTGGFQPDKLSRSLNGDADGLYARVLFSWPAEAPYRPLTDTVAEIEPEFENALTKLIELAEFEDGKLVIRYATLAHNAVAAFEDFRRLTYRKKDGLGGRERDWWVKTPAHVLRLASTLAYLDWAMGSAGVPAPTTIEARFVAAAVRLVTHYFWPHARAALRQIGLTERHAQARKVLRWLRAERGPEDEVSLQDVRRTALGQSVDAEATTKLIDGLVRAGWVRRAPTVKTDGRPVYRWQINPLLWNAESARSAESRSEESGQPLSALSALSAPALENSRSGDQGDVTWTV